MTDLSLLFIIWLKCTDNYVRKHQFFFSLQTLFLRLYKQGTFYSLLFGLRPDFLTLKHPSPSCSPDKRVFVVNYLTYVYTLFFLSYLLMF
jgi:hypothetical protein